jgi:AhpC/TSA family
MSDGPLSFPDDEPAPREEREPREGPAGPDEPVPAAPPPARPPVRYGWLVGVVVAAVLVYIGLNTLRNAGSVTRGVDPGHRLPPFAVPLAASRLDGDANVATRPGEGQRGRRPACEVRGPDVLNVCQLYADAPLALAFVATGAGRCAGELDRFERARSRFPGVRFAAVAARTNRPKLRREIRERGWHFPVGFDRDGAVFARYGIIDCPTIVFAYRGGVAMKTTFQPLGSAELDAELARLVAGQRKRAPIVGRNVR